MRIKDIVSFPVSWPENPGYDRCHESVMRSFQILEKVKYYLQEGMPSKLILELIYEMEDKPEEIFIP